MYGYPTSVVVPGTWYDSSWTYYAVPSTNVKCCGHIDGGSSSVSAPVIKESSPDVLWNVAKNACGLFGLTWSFLAVAHALSVYQYCLGAQTWASRIRRAPSRGVFMPASGSSGPVVQLKAVIAPYTQPSASV